MIRRLAMRLRRVKFSDISSGRRSTSATFIHSSLLAHLSDLLEHQGKVELNPLACRQLGTGRNTGPLGGPIRPVPRVPSQVLLHCARRFRPLGKIVGIQHCSYSRVLVVCVCLPVGRSTLRLLVRSHGDRGSVGLGFRRSSTSSEAAGQHWQQPVVSGCFRTW